MKKNKNFQADRTSVSRKKQMGRSQKSLRNQEPLAKYFPNIRSRKEVFELICSNKELKDIFYQWNEREQSAFLDCCTGARGMKVLYDGIFKEVFNPEITPERLEELLSLLIKRKLKIRQVLPNDSVRLGAESSLLYTDIIIQLEDGSLANVEIQKIGYAFPGERCACYSADHLLRQYKRVRGEQGKNFNYRSIKNVYTIVFFEQSPNEFHKFPDQWLHIFRQQSNTGLFLELLQEYYFIPLDIFRKTMENKCIENGLEAWLAFLCYDEPERIEELICQYPKFKTMYQDIYEVCRNMEKVMNMYSKELQELDHNTVLYMIDEMQEQLNKKTAELEKINMQLKERGIELERNIAQLEEQGIQLEEQGIQLEEQGIQLEEQGIQLEEKDVQLEKKDAQLKDLEELVRQLQEQISALQGCS